jgi:large subunit ribosomal protein L19
MNQLEKFEETLLSKNAPDLKIGQTVKVSLRVVEGDKERIQVYEGVVIGKKGIGHRATVTVRKVSYGVGVERIFPLHSPLIQKVVVVREGVVNRAKLYYLRELSGRAVRLADKKRDVKKGIKVVSPDQMNTAPNAEALVETAAPVASVASAG